MKNYDVYNNMKGENKPFQVFDSSSLDHCLSILL